MLTVYAESRALKKTIHNNHRNTETSGSMRGSYGAKMRNEKTNVPLQRPLRCKSCTVDSRYSSLLFGTNLFVPLHLALHNVFSNNSERRDALVCFQRVWFQPLVFFLVFLILIPNIDVYMSYTPSLSKKIRGDLGSSGSKSSILI